MLPFRFATLFPVLLGILLPVQSWAETGTTVTSKPYRVPVIELYTSEGCNSCPPADQFLAELSKTPDNKLDALGLAFHVDYWNYLGWKDEFSSLQYTNRQRKLGKKNRQTTIYTPEFFVDGIEVRGTKAIIDRIRRINSQLASIQLDMEILTGKNNMKVLLKSDQIRSPTPLAHVVVFENNLSNYVKSGENSGKRLAHESVVRYFSTPLSFAGRLEHVVPNHPDWKLRDLGVAAVVLSAEGDYLQSVHALPFESTDN